MRRLTVGAVEKSSPDKIPWAWHFGAVGVRDVSCHEENKTVISGAAVLLLVAGCSPQIDASASRTTANGVYH
ncbi:hypothetical protein SKAU_G00086050 [Synaphobranchus kaupii]|uniref:Uncharacterized protein n=1 Tax=Synaphobranchus kaupii TaxID=118154 RepID=A0A9Q1FVX7_SYNKA|nr:hypothetical protein SKAU_G00086050 [Synaphobranchus kaupii]